MKKTVQKVFSGAAALFLGLSHNSFAALPTTSDPTNAAADGDYIGLLQGYAFDIGIVIGLIVGTVAFVAVSNQMIGTYTNIGRGRATWGDMGMQAGAGVLLLVFVVYLLTEAAAIIF